MKLTMTVVRSQSQNLVDGETVNLNADENERLPKKSRLSSHGSSVDSHQLSTNMNSNGTASIYGANGTTPDGGDDVALPAGVTAAMKLGIQESMKSLIGSVDVGNGDGNNDNDGEGAQGNENEHGVGSVTQVNGYVYKLWNNKWDKIGDAGNCQISMYGKSLNNGNYSNLNGMMTLSNTEVDGRVIITHVFEFNGSELQTKGPNAWRLICKEVTVDGGNDNGTTTLAIRFIETKDAVLFSNTYKWIISSDIKEQMAMRSMGLQHETQGGPAFGNTLGGFNTTNGTTTGGTTTGGDITDGDGYGYGYNYADDNQVDVGLEMGYLMSKQEQERTQAMGNGNNLKAVNNAQLNSHDQSDSSDVSVDDMFAHCQEGGEGK